MEYLIEFRDPVLAYIAGIEGLTEEDRAAILDGVIEELSRSADHFMRTRALGHESFYFRYDYPHPVMETMTVHTFDFIASGEFMEMGIVRLVFVEHSTQPAG